MDVRTVLNAVARTAARLCDANDALIFQSEGGQLRLVAKYGPLRTTRVFGEPFPLTRGTVHGRAVLDRRTIHIRDLAVAVRREFPELKTHQQGTGVRTFLSTPMLFNGKPIGVITIRRTKVRPFTAKQIALLKTFADQAAIAIENARLSQELESRNRNLTEALEQQTATAEILRVISSSPTDLQPVLDTVVRNAARLCEASDVGISLIDGDVLRKAAGIGPWFEALPPDFSMPITRGSVTGRAVVDRAAIHVADLAAEPEKEYPIGREVQRRYGHRTTLVTPLLREGIPLGAISIVRMEVRAFTDKQIALLKTFADQAVIAIENVRLFQELQARNRDLTEALKQQTATAEILRVISSSPTDLQPVFEAIIASAARLCGASCSSFTRFDGDLLHLTAVHNVSPEQWQVLATRWFPRRPDPDFASGRAVLEQRVIHIDDVLDIPTNPLREDYRQAFDYRSWLAAPVLKDGRTLGVISVWGPEPLAFTQAQIALVQTFADQAAIAIENVRLFQELQVRNRDLTEALEQQTATSEILGVISGSPTDVQPVFDTIVRSAVRLCDARYSAVYRFDGELIHLAAHHNFTPEALAEVQRAFPMPVGDESLIGRAIRDRQLVHVPDLDRDPSIPPASRNFARVIGNKNLLVVPMLREGKPIGGIVVGGSEPGPFSDSHIGLLKTFADQAVIAIENVRLFNETKEALEQQTATSEVLNVISRSTLDVMPVFQAVVEKAVELCGADNASILRREADVYRYVANAGNFADQDTFMSYWGTITLRPGRGSVTGRVALERRSVQIEDIDTDPEYEREYAAHKLPGSKTHLGVPLLKDGEPIGLIIARRFAVRPFTEKQIKLLETFAAQAVIAIENVRLFQELQARNRDLTEALEQQTATSEILRVISSSPTDLQPIFETIVESAVRLCDGFFGAVYRYDGELIHLVAHHNLPPEVLETLRLYPMRPGHETVTGRTILERTVLHIENAAEQASHPSSRELARQGGYRTLLSVPMLREGNPIGSISVSRQEMRPFSDKQIELVKTFADQAVIAIENVRLFQELQARTRELARSVAELKALGEVGQAVSSTLDLETVLTTIVARALQLSGADGGVIYEYDEVTQEFHLRTTYRMEEELVEIIREAGIRLGEGTVGKAAASRAPLQVPDIRDEREYTATRIRPVMARLGYRSILAVPLLIEDRILGALAVWRREVGNFASEVVNLLQNFATQSVLAIQNARLFREIEEKSRQLEIASKHKSQFLANMSHELRTPLNAILGYTEMILDQIYGELPEKIKDVMARIDKSGRHLLGLINDVLDLSKIEAGQLALSLNDYSMKEVVQTVFTAMESLAAEKKLALKVTVAPDLPRGRGDERRISQVLLNLVGNAIKFTEAGEVRVEATVSDGAFLVSVSDTGPGIAPEDQARIFEEFQQVDTSDTRKKGGTGLGLAIARRIIEMHGGRMWVESDPGKGSTFRFTLPVRVER